MKKQYRHQEKITDPVIIEPKIEEIPKISPPKENQSKESIFNRIKNDGATPFIMLIIILSIGSLSYGLWTNQYVLDKNITIKVITTSSGAYLVDECNNIYEYSPMGFDAFEIGGFYSADLIKYPNYDFKQNRKLVNYHKINKSEYIKNCS